MLSHAWMFLSVCKFMSMGFSNLCWVIQNARSACTVRRVCFSKLCWVMPECFGCLCSEESVFFKIMLSHARVFWVFIQWGECIFQNYAESCQSVLSVCTMRRMCFSKFCWVMPECFECLYSEEKLFFKIMLSHARVFLVFVQ